jgi:hypothetical protein
VADSRRYLGLELAGAKNQKTALAALEYYPREQKIFLLDIYDKITGHRDPHEPHERITTSQLLSPAGTYGLTTTGDVALMELLQELTEDAKPRDLKMGVNVPLVLPPCLISTLKTAAKPSAATVASVKWMREATRKAEKELKQESSGKRVLEFTTYTQRPIELWIRYQVLSKLPKTHHFEIDETLGGNKAPLTARMNFLRCHLGDLDVVEVWPKLTVAILAVDMELPKRLVQGYRHLEEGVHAREQIIDRLAARHGIFIYERDVRKLAQSLPAFDAFICAYTALLSDIQGCAKSPAGFPVASGWVQYPQC